MSGDSAFHWRVFSQRKMAANLLLGFSGGVPLFLTSRTLQAWMTAEKVDLATIGYFSLVGLPYSMKFLWSPLIDRYCPPFFGRRRGWIAIAQMALSLGLAVLAFGDPKTALQAFAFTALAVAFLSATLDIAVDAYRVDTLEPHEMGPGIALYVVGYRAALLLTGSAALILADHMSWNSVYLIMAAIMALGLVFTAWSPEPERSVRPPDTLTQAVVEPFLDFFARSKWRAAVILIFITLYRLADSLANNMATPFLLKSGFTQTDVGAIQGGIGLLATIVGALCGGAVITHISINRSLWLFGVLQIASNLGYYILSLNTKYPVMVGCIIVENFCAGLVVAGFGAFFMALCSPKYSATQYALMTSLMAFSRDILVAPAGKIAAAAGWPGFFLITIAAGLPGMLLLPVFAPWNQPLPLGARVERQ